MNNSISYKLGRLFESMCNIEWTYNRKNNIAKMSPVVESSEMSFLRRPLKTSETIFHDKLGYMMNWFEKSDGFKYKYVLNDYKTELENVCENEECSSAKVESIEEFVFGRIQFRRDIRDRIKDMKESKNSENPVE